MPTFRITAPDGAQYNVTGPDGSTEQDALAQVQAQHTAPAEPQAPPRTEVTTAAAHPVPHTGYAAQVREMAAAGPNKGGPARPVGDIAQSYADIAGGIPTGMAGTASAVGPVGDVEGIARHILAKVGAPVSTDTTVPTTHGVETFLAGEPANQDVAMGRTIGEFLGPGAALKMLKGGARAASHAIPGAGPTEAATAAHEAGYALPPAMASEKPGVVSQVLGLSGKLKLQQAASAKNQEVTNRLAAQSLGLPEGEPITPESLKAVRAVANEAYADVAKSVSEIKADEPFVKIIDGLGKRTSEASKAFPSLVNNTEIEALADTLKGAKAFSPEAGIELVRHLRADASANRKAFSDPARMALGKSQKQAAEAVDNLIERNLTAMDKPDLVHAYRDARQQLARTYDVEAALDPAGNVSAHALAAKLKKGRPLTGPLRDIAEAGRNFPKATQNPSQFGGQESLSVMDLGAAGLSGGATIPLSLARPMARRALLSPTYQNLMMRTPGPASESSSPLVNAFALPGAVNPQNALNRP